MNTTTVITLLIVAHLIQGLLGLPVDRELLRVKRKGETELHQDVELVKKVRRSQEDKETELRHQRRFFAPETEEPKTQENYKTKMEARSSRSAREDNDITARRSERFGPRIHKRSSDDDGSSWFTGQTSGSGEEPGKSFTSSVELGKSKSNIPEIQSKRDEKRSMSTSSLESLISALTAISSLTPEDQDTSGSEEVESSGSGFWLAPEKEDKDDKLPKFFEEEQNSGRGENPEEALTRINEAAQKEFDRRADGEGSGETKIVKEDKQHKTGGKLFRRELRSDSLKDDLMAAVENNQESSDYDPADMGTSFSGSAMQFTEIEDESSTSGQADEDQFTKVPEVAAKPEVEPLPSVADILLPDSFYRARRSSQENFFLRTDNNLGKNDALDSDSLVARFYRDQDAHDDVTEISEAPLASLPSDNQAVFSAYKQLKPEKRESHYEHSADFSEPRVVYTREIRNAPEPIIERPAVYSRSEDEDEMDSSFGGEDDDEEATVTIHEREIREDGYVGCFEDKSPERDLPTVLSVPHLTPDSCRSACQGAGHAYAGVQYGYLCRCGDSYGKYAKVPDEDCNALCTGDKTQKCGGFWRSAIFATAGVMQPSKRGNFFHIDSVQPLTEDIFDTPRSEIPSGDDQTQETSTITESAKVTYPAEPAPKEPPPIPIATKSESSGAYAQEIHRATDIQKSPVPSTPGVTVQEAPLPPNPDENNQQDVNVEHASAEGPVDANKDSPTAHASDSASLDKVSPAHDPTLPPSATNASQDLATQNQWSDVEKTPQQVTVPLDSPASQASRFSQPQNTQAPQGTHVSQLMYLHHQQDILSKPTPKSIVSVPPGKMEEGTVAYTGTIKLKQSWLDRFEDGESAESKILTGNIEQAFKRVFKDEPKFVNAEVVGLREGLVKHNPNTIRKVIAPFILTFHNGVEGVEAKLKNMIKNKEKLDDMPVYKDSLQIADYGQSTSTIKAKTVNDKVEEKHKGGEERRSAVNVPNGGVDPFLKGIFSQISTEMKDISS